MFLRVTFPASLRGRSYGVLLPGLEAHLFHVAPYGVVFMTGNVPQLTHIGVHDGGMGEEK